MDVSELYPRVTKDNVKSLGASLQSAVLARKRKCDVCRVVIQESRTGVRKWKQENDKEVVGCRDCHQSEIGTGLLLSSLKR
jgi:hypothetical protein